MGRKRAILIGLVCMFLLLTGQSVMAASGGGAEPVRDGQTDVLAGVVVDYMGKLQFLVIDRDTGEPIAGASVEIYIPSLNRYVLFGVTDENGILELDVAYGEREGQFTEADGQIIFSGITLFLKDNNITYRVYKAGWLPYPYDGTTVLEAREIPQVITIKLYKKSSGGGSGGSGGGGNGGTSTGTGPAGEPDSPWLPLQPDPGKEPASPGIPKTGVEDTMQYWIAGLLFFLIAGGITGFLLWNEKKIHDREQTKPEEAQERGRTY